MVRKRPPRRPRRRGLGVPSAARGTGFGGLPGTNPCIGLPSSPVTAEEVPDDSPTGLPCVPSPTAATGLVRGSEADEWADASPDGDADAGDADAAFCDAAFCCSLGFLGGIASFPIAGAIPSDANFAILKKNLRFSMRFWRFRTDFDKNRALKTLCQNLKSGSENPKP